MQGSIEVSVICPLYNMEDFLSSFIKSYQKQKNIKKELIIVDDASSDNSLAVAKYYAEDDLSIKVINLKENKGSGNARNVGLNASSGEFVMFADPDDELAYSFSLNHLYKAAKKYRQDIVMGNVLFSFMNDNLKVVSWAHDFFIGSQIKSWEQIKCANMWQCLFKKSFLIENNIYFSEARRSQDSIFMWNIRLKSDKVLCVNNYIYNYKILYRFINITYEMISTVLQASYDFLEKAKVTNTRKLKFDSFFSDNDSSFPSILSWMSPLGFLDNDLLTSEYAIKKEDASNFLEKFNKLKEIYKDFYLDYLRENNDFTNNEKLVYKVNKKANLVFTKYTGTDTFVPSQNTKNYLKTIKNVHLCSYTNNFSYVVDKFNQDTDLIIFVRTGDTLPFQHAFPSKKSFNVVDDVNLQGLTLIFKECSLLQNIYLHSLDPMATYIFLQNNESLLKKCILDFVKVPSKEFFNQNQIIQKVISRIDKANCIFDSDLNKLKELFSSINVTKTHQLSFYADSCVFIKSNNAQNILIFSDNLEYTRKSLERINVQNYSKVISIFSDLSPNSKLRYKELVKDNQLQDISYFLSRCKLYDLLSETTKVIYNVTRMFDLELISFCIKNDIEIVSDIKEIELIIKEIKNSWQLR